MIVMRNSGVRPHRRTGAAREKGLVSMSFRSRILWWLGRVALAVLVAAALQRTGGSASAQIGQPPVRLPDHTLSALGQAGRVTQNAAVSDQPLTLTIVLRRSDEPGFTSFLQ